MTRIPVYVGVDYHQKSVQVCVENRSGEVLLNSRCPNDGQAITDRVSALGAEYEVAGCAIEASCGAADLAEELIRQAGWLVNLAHPGYVSRMKQGPDKHDWGDARMLSDLERVGHLPVVWLAPQEIRELRRLVRYRQSQAKQRRDVKLRIGALLRDHRVTAPEGMNRWTRAWLHWLRQVVLPEQSRWIMDCLLDELDRLRHDMHRTERRLAEVTADDPVVNHLRTLAGIGPVTSWMLRAEIGWFHRFRSGKQLARFCGLSPRNASSGERQADAGLIKAGNVQLRSVLIEGAHRLIWHHPRWKALAVKLLEKGKPKSVVAAAVANRWIRWMYHQVTDASLVA
jgi:transposase